MKVVKYKEGDDIPMGSKYLYSKTLRVNYEESNWTWCGCHDLLDCNCATWDDITYHYYEVYDDQT